MARATKTGLDYFPLDVNFLLDRKVRRLVRKHGAIAPTTLIALLSQIYRERGYYLPWNEDICFDLSEIADTDMDTMHAIIADALRADFFDSEQFKRNAILTSRAIQEQYITCTQKRKTVVIEESYALIDKKVVMDRSTGISSPLQDIPEEETLFFGTEMQQSKGKEKEMETESRQKANQTSPLSPPETAGKEERRSIAMHEINGKMVPEYCLNKRTHNYDGLLRRLTEIRVREEKEVDAILKMSNYGRIGHPVWGIISYDNWPKGNSIKLPGRFIIAQLNKLK